MAKQDLQAARVFQQDLAVSPLVARVLVARSFRDSVSARKFLSPDLSHLHDPFLLANMQEGARRLAQAVAQKESILLYGDYDVDGTCSLVILKTVIGLCGGKAECFVPHRLKDGYGMKNEAVEEAAARGVTLIVSVDTGIRAGAVVEHARGLGIDVIVTDHHLPEAELPQAVAVINPNRHDCSYPEKHLCGAAVAWKLATALLAELQWPAERRAKLLDSLMKLAAIATVADVVPLTGENRVIVKRGLEGLRQVNNAGLRALLDIANVVPGGIPSARQIAFQVAPRLNAAGRMDSAQAVIDLFSAADAASARVMAERLDLLNRDRRQEEERIQKSILEKVLEQPATPDDWSLVFAEEGWHRGVVGIVASRVVERHHRPAFVISIENGVAQGSGRSIRAFHLLEALESMSDLFHKFGGHKYAAGLTMPADRIDEFRRRLNAFAASKLTADDLAPELELDAEVAFEEIHTASVMELLELAPFGMENPLPIILLRNVEITSPPEIRNDKHMFLRIGPPGRQFRVKAWNFAERAAEFATGARLDFALQFEDDSHSASRGYAPWQAIVRDVRPAQQAPGVIK